MHLNSANPVIQYETSAVFRFKAVKVWWADLSMNLLQPAKSFISTSTEVQKYPDFLLKTFLTELIN